MKVSIVTVNLNNATGLEKTIQSVVSQTFTDYEYIIIDGNSSDNSVEVIKQYADHISYWVSEPDAGIYNAMNKGIKQAKGDYVIFMNSADCFINSDTLSNVFSKEHTADLLVGNMIEDRKRLKARCAYPSKLTFYYFFAGQTLVHQATFTKRTLFDELGLYDEHLKICADWKFALLALFKYNKSIENLHEDIALMDLTGLSYSDNAQQCIRQEREETLKKYFPYFYDDYQELYRLKQYSLSGLKRLIIGRRMRKFLRG
ncbi:glycosyl transferase [Bacteroidia bacterium]|nr:glycosyl transferase [Bacteroidia bacterium]